MKYKDMRKNGRYKLVRNSRSNPGAVIGQTYTIKQKSSSTYVETVEIPGYWFSANDFEVAVTSVIQLQRELAAAEEQVADIKAKLAYLAEAQLDEFDEDQFRCYQALTIAEDTTKSKVERSQALAELMKKK